MNPDSLIPVKIRVEVTALNLLYPNRATLTRWPDLDLSNVIESSLTGKTTYASPMDYVDYAVNAKIESTSKIWSEVKTAILIILSVTIAGTTVYILRKMHQLNTEIKRLKQQVYSLTA